MQFGHIPVIFEYMSDHTDRCIRQPKGRYVQKVEKNTKPSKGVGIALAGLAVATAIAGAALIKKTSSEISVSYDSPVSIDSSAVEQAVNQAKIFETFQAYALSHPFGSKTTMEDLNPKTAIDSAAAKLYLSANAEHLQNSKQVGCNLLHQ